MRIVYLIDRVLHAYSFSANGESILVSEIGQKPLITIIV